MENCVSLAVREYGNGRIGITSDRLSGFLTNHGFGSRKMWRNLLEWLGQRYTSESINVAIVKTYPVPTLDYMNAFGQISSQEIDLTNVISPGLDAFDLVYFVGLPPFVSTPVANALQIYVENGGGLLLEVPDISGSNINVLSSIENVYCTSSERPLYTQAYWTATGLTTTIYDKNADLFFFNTLLQSSFSNNWNILMTNVPVVSSTPAAGSLIPTMGWTGAEFGISYASAFVNGAVVLDEDVND